MTKEPQYKLGDIFYQVTPSKIIVEEAIAVGIGRKANNYYVYELLARGNYPNRDHKQLFWCPTVWIEEECIRGKVRNKEWFLSEEEAMEQFKKLSRRKT
jgi:hypothetical protein